MMSLADEILEFGKIATAGMAKTLQMSVKMLREDETVTHEDRVAYARLLREQGDLCLAAAEALEKE